MSPFHFIRQLNQRDGAAACLAMVSRYHGGEYPHSRFSELTKTDRRGASMYALVTGAQSVGLAAEGLSGTFGDLLSAIASGQVTLPAVAHVREGGMLHFVVVHDAGDNTVGIADPARGLRELTFQDFASLYTGYIVAFSKSPAITPLGQNV